MVRILDKPFKLQTRNPINRPFGNWTILNYLNTKQVWYSDPHCIIVFVLNRAEELRRARNEEARQLISQRSENPRAVFERNTSVGQLNYRRQVTADNSKPKPPIAKQTFAEPQIVKQTFAEEPKPQIVKETFIEQPKAEVVKQTFAEETKPQIAKQDLAEEQKPQIATLPREEVTRTNVEERKIEVPKAVVKQEIVNNSKPLGNMVHTDDIVVPPPDSFGNEDSMKRQPEMVRCEPDVTSGAHQPDLVDIFKLDF